MKNLGFYSLMLGLLTISVNSAFGAQETAQGSSAVRNASIQVGPIADVELKGADGETYYFGWLEVPAYQDRVLIKCKDKPFLKADGSKNFACVSPATAKEALPNGLYYWQSLDGKAKAPFSELIDISAKAAPSEDDQAIIEQVMVSNQPQNARLYRKNIASGSYVDDQNHGLQWNAAPGQQGTVEQLLISRAPIK